MVQHPDAPGMTLVNCTARCPSVPVFPVKMAFSDENPMKPSFQGNGSSFLVTLTLNVALATGGDAGCAPEPFEPLPTPTPAQHCVSHCKRHFVLVVMTQMAFSDNLRQWVVSHCNGEAHWKTS